MKTISSVRRLACWSSRTGCPRPGSRPAPAPGRGCGSSASSISPPSTTVWPLCTVTRLVILRWVMVGVRSPVAACAASATRLTSCAISRHTAPLTLIRGRTCRMTPVLRYSMLLTTGASTSSTLTAWRVVIGTSSPTVSVASRLSWTTTDGEDSTLTSVTRDRASIVTFELPPVIEKVEAGNDRQRVDAESPLACAPLLKPKAMPLVLDEILHAVTQRVVERDLGDRGLDQHLKRGDVEAQQRRFHGLVRGRRGADQERVVGLVGHDLDPARQGRARRGRAEACVGPPLPSSPSPESSLSDRSCDIRCQGTPVRRALARSRSRRHRRPAPRCRPR